MRTVKKAFNQADSVPLCSRCCGALLFRCLLSMQYTNTFKSIVCWQLKMKCLPETSLSWRKTSSPKLPKSNSHPMTHRSVQFSSVTQSCLTLCNPMNRSMPGFPIHHQLPEFIQTHVHQVSDAIQPSHPLSSPSPPAPNPTQHQGLFQWVSSSHQVAKVLEFQLQHQSFQWTPRTDLL